MSTVVHLVRHGQIPDYETDQPLTSEGKQEAIDVGQGLAAQIRPGETIRFHSSPTRRARQTAMGLRDGLAGALSRMALDAAIIPIVAVDDRLQNFQFLLDGLSYDPIHPLFEVARWRLQKEFSPHYEACVAFHSSFWCSSDPMAYWLTHPGEAVETPESVAERIHAYVAERLKRSAGAEGVYRDICVTHSANLRAFLRLSFGADPGEPPYCGLVTVSDGRVQYQWAGDKEPRAAKFE